MTSRPSTAALILAVVPALLAAYVGAYFWLGEPLPLETSLLRVYSTDWQATLFTPAAYIESTLRQSTVGAIGPSDIPNRA